MKQYIKKSFVLLYLSIAVAVGVVLGLSMARGIGEADSFGGQSDKINYVLRTIERNYVDSVSVDSLAETAIREMLSSLDPHSRYLSTEEVALTNESLVGEFDGIGVVLITLDDTIAVRQVMEGGAAEKAGLMIGDRIISVDDTQVAGVGMKTDKIIPLIKGPKRTNVKLGIRRGGAQEVTYFNVQRYTVPTPSVSYSGMVSPTVGYIHLSSFTRTSHEEFCKALKALTAQGMTHLIFDLRGNGGGLMGAAVDIADELLPGNELIVYTQGLHEKRSEIRSHRGGLFASGGLTVMIDENSASASEIVAGAMQDNDRATIVGRRSFGKGLVQRDITLPDNSAMLLTISRYYTPSGRCIQRSYKDGVEAYYNDYMQHLLEETSGDSSSIAVFDSTPYYTAEGRIVYGGGGILPDVPLKVHSDTAYIYINRMISKGIFNRLAFDYVEKHQGKLRQQYPTLESFADNFSVSQTLLNELFARADKANIKRNAQTISKYSNYIKRELKAQIAFSLYGQAAYLRIRMTDDDDLTATIAMINNNI